ncbi:MAG: aromatic ring-hydroxylating dioxygenase subunit alpha [Oligoflexales bacterium]
MIRPEINPKDLEVLPITQASTIPSRWYTDAEFFAFDQKNILAKHWQYLGHISQLRHPGDYIVGEIAGNPVIVVRDKDGALNGFYNVCRHRGGPLATENGNAKMLRCMYHGWSYNLQGQLVGAPRFEGVENFDIKSCRLPRIHVETYAGMVLVTLSANPKPAANFFAGIRERILPVDLEKKQFSSRVVYSINCNWKVYIDNYMEGYHISHVHPELDSILDQTNYTTQIHENYILQHSPFKPNSEDENIYATESGQAAFYYLIFPNMMLNILPGRLQINSVVPVGRDKTLVIFDYFYDDLKSESAKKLIEEDLKYSDIVQQQDIRICEYVQKGLASDSYTQGRISVLEEQGVYHFQSRLKQAYRDALIP